MFIFIILWFFNYLTVEKPKLNFILFDKILFYLIKCIL